MTKTNDAMRRELDWLRGQFEERVRERAELILTAAKIAPNALLDASMSDDEIRATTVAYAKGYPFIEGKSQEYLHAYFDHLSSAQEIDPVALALRAGPRSH